MTHDRSLPGVDTVTRVVLDNGVIILVYEHPAVRSVVVAGELVGGSQFDPAGRPGLASFTAAALLRGTQSRSFDDIGRALEDIGADFGFSAAVHHTTFSGKALAEDLPVLLDLLADGLREPAFPDERIERLRDEIITGLTIRRQDTRYRARRAFQEALYPPDHPYHNPVDGTPDSIASFAVAELHAFHHAHFSADGLIIVIVGAVKAEAAVDLVRARLSDWRGAPRSTPLPEPSVSPTARRIDVRLPGKSQADLVIGALGPARSDSDYLAARIANSVLGQFGMMGRVGAVVREQLGLAYYAYSALEAAHSRPPWSVVAGVDPDSIDLALERIQAELRRLIDEPISADDLADNQSLFIGYLPIQLESSEGIAATLADIESFGLGLDYLRRFRDQINAITVDAVQAAARRWLNPDALIVAVAAPED